MKSVDARILVRLVGDKAAESGIDKFGPTMPTLSRSCPSKLRSRENAHNSLKQLIASSAFSIGSYARRGINWSQSIGYWLPTGVRCRRPHRLDEAKRQSKLEECDRSHHFYSLESSVSATHIGGSRPVRFARRRASANTSSRRFSAAFGAIDFYCRQCGQPIRWDSGAKRRSPTHKRLRRFPGGYL
ncbi:hypothetical protein BurMR1_0931 [Burkholderia sp. MR1]|nr:hypothetical protein BurMR1_0931 [Burkholderia sp. MR1]